MSWEGSFLWARFWLFYTIFLIVLGKTIVQKNMHQGFLWKRSWFPRKDYGISCTYQGPLGHWPQLSLFFKSEATSKAGFLGSKYPNSTAYQNFVLNLCAVSKRKLPSPLKKIIMLIYRANLLAFLLNIVVPIAQVVAIYLLCC